MLTAVLFVPLAVLVHKVLTRENTPYMAVGTAFGVIAGVVQFLGLVRWPFLIPYLADTYLAPASSPATREAVAVIFQAFNQYAGVGVSENLGYLFTGLWTMLVALAMFGSPGRKSWEPTWTWYFARKNSGTRGLREIDSWFEGNNDPLQP
jgi:hypothetical protein